MASPPRVSAIIIFLNEERFLAEAVQSVVSQSFEDWELLLVDDGSSDASAEIALGMTRMDPCRIRLLTHPGGGNHGMSASRNLGIAQARGEFIGFLDADDVWLPGKLAEQIRVLEDQSQAALVYGRTLIWNSWNELSMEADFFYDLGVEPGRLYRPPRLLELLLENKAQSPTACNALMRRSLFERVGGFEESFRGMFEDQVFFVKAHAEAPAWVDSREWARYRQHPDSCSATSAAAGEDRRARLRFLRWVNGYLSRRGGVDPRIRRSVQQELWETRRLVAKATVRRLIKGARKS